jgi:hypothetical protein
MMCLKRNIYSLHRILVTLNNWCLEKLFQVSVSTVVSSCERFSTTIEAEEGRTEAAVSFGSSSSLREDIWDQT